jgi:predicted metal-dependent peptidase
MYSNKISRITLKELKGGKVETTGGTDFDCVMNHAASLPHGVKKVVAFTDGYWGWGDDSLKKLEKRGTPLEFFFVCTPDGTRDNMKELPFNKSIITMKEPKT